MAKVEQQPGQRDTPIKLVHFDSSELTELSIRQQYNVPGFGRISIPSKTYFGNRYLQDAVEELGMQHKVHGQTALSSGNVVLIPSPEHEHLGEKVGAIGQDQLQSVLNFASQEKMQSAIDYVDILPNASQNPRKLNGVRMQFNPGDWLKHVNIRNFGALGRGLMIVPFPREFDVDWFINHENRVLSILFAFGRSFSQQQQPVKFIQFLYGEDGELSLALAAGPSPLERVALADQVTTIQGQKGRLESLSQLLKLNEQAQKDLRRRMAENIFNWLGLQQPIEEVVNLPYIWFDTETMSYCNGGIATQGDAALTDGDSMIIHRPNGFFTLGTGVSPIDPRNILLPSEVSVEHLNTPRDKSKPPHQVKGRKLDVLAKAFHSDWKVQTK